MQKSPWRCFHSPGTFLLSYLICSYLLFELVYINMKYLLESIFQTNLTTPAAVVIACILNRICCLLSK